METTENWRARPMSLWDNVLRIMEGNIIQKQDLVKLKVPLSISRSIILGLIILIFLFYPAYFP